MDRLTRFLICAICFLMLTVLKMIAPDTVSEIKMFLLPIIENTEYYEIPADWNERIS